MTDENIIYKIQFARSILLCTQQISLTASLLFSYNVYKDGHCCVPVIEV